MEEMTTGHEAFLRPDTVPFAAEDPLYGLVTAYENDECLDKIDLGVGAYRDESAKPWILPVIRKASYVLADDPLLNHEYIPIAGLPDFTSAAQELILGKDSPAIAQKRVCSFQAISGTGAVHMGGLLLSRYMDTGSSSSATIMIPSPSWPIHRQCFENVALKVEEYPYFEALSRTLAFEDMLSSLRAAQQGTIVLLQACAHNPTGVDPTPKQWTEIAQVMRERRLLAFFDCAYQGFATGSLEQDNFAIRHFVNQGFEIVIAQSFAKNMGLYGQRVGAFHYIAGPGPHAEEIVQRVASQLSVIQRSEISSPPIYGAKLASIVLNDKQLFAEWERDLQTMASRIIEMRASLRHELERLGTPGSWTHITDQIGMFSFTGLTESQVARLRSKWHVYMLGNGRISVAGLNRKNVRYFACAIDDVVRNSA